MVNIVWADDEVHVLHEDNQDMLSDKGIAVHHMCETGIELQECLSKYSHLIDAIIVDANFDKSSTNFSSESNLRGLSLALHLEDKYPEIPMYIYTGRKEGELKSGFPQGDLDTFFESDRVFFKHKQGDVLEDILSDFEKMLDRIVQDTARIPECKVRRMYEKAIEVAKVLNRDADFIQWAVEFEKGNVPKAYNGYNVMRKILEPVKDGIVEKDILPTCDLNAFPKMMAFGPGPKGYTNNHDPRFANDSLFCNDQFSIMPDFLANSLVVSLSLQQGGSHGGTQNGKVDQYTRDTGRDYLMRSCFNTVAETLAWYGDLCENMKLGRIPQPFGGKYYEIRTQQLTTPATKKKSNNNVKQDNDGPFLLEETVLSDGTKTMRAGNYEIINCSWQPGVKVFCKKSQATRRPIQENGMTMQINANGCIIHIKK